MNDISYHGLARLGTVYEVRLGGQRVGTVKKEPHGWIGLADGVAQGFGPCFRRKDVGRLVARGAFSAEATRNRVAAPRKDQT